MYDVDGQKDARRLGRTMCINGQPLQVAGACTPSQAAMKREIICGRLRVVSECMYVQGKRRGLGECAMMW